MDYNNIKNEPIYRMALNYVEASKRLKETIIEQLTSDIEINHDCEINLGGDGVVVTYGDGEYYVDDYAKAIYMCDGVWFVGTEYDEYPLVDLDCAILLNLYECYEQTLKELENEKIADDMESQIHAMRQQYGEDFIPLFHINDSYAVSGIRDADIVREYTRTRNVPATMDNPGCVAVYSSNLETLLVYLVKDKKMRVGIVEIQK